jgi:hypothetical protein
LAALQFWQFSGQGEQFLKSLELSCQNPAPQFPVQTPSLSHHPPKQLTQVSGSEERHFLQPFLQGLHTALFTGVKLSPQS